MSSWANTFRNARASSGFKNSSSSWCGLGWALWAAPWRGHVPAGQVQVAPGVEVKAGQVLLVIESMKMEITVQAPCDGRIEQLLCAEGQSVTAGQALVLMR